MNQSQGNEMDRQIIVGPANEKNYLPSVDYKEHVAPIQDDEIHLRDYLDVIVRRKLSIFLVLLFIFFGTALYTLTSTPLFKGKGTLKASASQGQVTSFEDIQTTALKTMEFQQTQVNLLESEQLALRIIDKLDLLKNPFFNEELRKDTADDASLSSLVQAALASVKNFIRFSSETEGSLTEEEQQHLLLDDIVEKLRDELKISPVRNSELIQLSFESPDPRLSADVINTAMEEFVQMLMDTNIDSSKTAAQFLEKQILAAQIKLEKSEKELREFVWRATVPAVFGLSRTRQYGRHGDRHYSIWYCWPRNPRNRTKIKIIFRVFSWVSWLKLSVVALIRAPQLGCSFK